MAKDREKKLKEDSSSELEITQQKCEEYLNGWRRAAAELENFKKEEIRRSSQTSEFVKRQIFSSLLPVLDSIDRAKGSEQGQNQGLKMIESQLREIFHQQGIEKIETKVGDEFDPNIHEAVGHKESKNELKEKIAEVVDAGYKLEDKVIRATKVLVGK